MIQSRWNWGDQKGLSNDMVPGNRGFCNNNNIIRSSLCLIFHAFVMDIGISPFDSKARNRLMDTFVSLGLLQNNEAQYLRSSFLYWYKAQLKRGILPPVSSPLYQPYKAFSAQIREVMNIDNLTPLKVIFYMHGSQLIVDTSRGFCLAPRAVSAPGLPCCKSPVGFNFTLFKEYFATLHPLDFPIPSDVFRQAQRSGS
jgi:hypothetical protein